MWRSAGCRGVLPLLNDASPSIYSSVHSIIDNSVRLITAGSISLSVFHAISPYCSARVLRPEADDGHAEERLNIGNHRRKIVCVYRVAVSDDQHQQHRPLLHRPNPRTPPRTRRAARSNRDYEGAPPHSMRLHLSRRLRGCRSPMSRPLPAAKRTVRRPPPSSPSPCSRSAWLSWREDGHDGADHGPMVWWTVSWRGCRLPYLAVGRLMGSSHRGRASAPSSQRGPARTPQCSCN